MFICVFARYHVCGESCCERKIVDKPFWCLWMHEGLLVTSGQLQLVSRGLKVGGVEFCMRGRTSRVLRYAASSWTGSTAAAAAATALSKLLNIDQLGGAALRLLSVPAPGHWESGHPDYVCPSPVNQYRTAVSTALIGRRITPPPAACSASYLAFCPLAPRLLQAQTQEVPFLLQDNTCCTTSSPPSRIGNGCIKKC